MKHKAFTLIELLVVVAIIGILAAVGVVAYTGYTGAAKKNVVKQHHKMMIKEFRALVIKFETSFADIDVLGATLRSCLA